MATQTTSKLVQIVGREEDRDIVFNKDGLQRLIDNYCDEKMTHDYAVFSIVGAQSSGKSTLMNGIFNTKFAVMDESKERGRTTKGIWASICNDDRAIVLDVEGTDSVDNQNDLGFETRTALFSLVISDVIFVNIWLQEVNRAHGNPLLKKIFEEVEKQAGPEGLPEQYQTKIVFAVRNYNGRTPEDKLKEAIISNVNEIWRTIPQMENSKFENYFKLHVELFPDLEHEEFKFYNKCKELREYIGRGDWLDRNVAGGLPVSAFPSYAKEIWEKILENKILDIPSQMEMMTRMACDSIMLDKFQHFRSTGYLELASHQYDDPKQFEDKLMQILDDCISLYNKETRLYGKHADEKKIDLETKILHHAEQQFLSVMKAFQKKIFFDTTMEIISACGMHTSRSKERAKSKVSKYQHEFVSKTEGLVYYNKLVDTENFMLKLEKLGEKMAHHIKKKNKKCLYLRIAISVLSGVSSGAHALGVISKCLPDPIAIGIICGIVGAITKGAAVACATVLAECQNKDNIGIVAEEVQEYLSKITEKDPNGNAEEVQEHLSKILEAASSAAELSQLEMDPNGNAVQLKEHLSKIMEAASSAAELSQLEVDPNGNAVAVANKLGINTICRILGTDASGETGGTAAVRAQSMKSSIRAAVEAGHKLGEKMLSIIMEAESSGYDLRTAEDTIDRCVPIIFKGLSEDP